MSRSLVAFLLLASALAAVWWWSRTRGDVAPDGTTGLARTDTAPPEPARVAEGPLLGVAPPVAAPLARPDGAVDDAYGVGILAGDAIVEGQLVDPQGRPLAGIPLYLAFATPTDYEMPDQWVHFGKGPDSDGGAAEASRYESHTVTDAAGRFRMDATILHHLSSGSSGGSRTVRVVPSHPSWIESKRPSEAEGGLQRAEPAASLAVHVVDDHGVPIPSLRAVIREPARRGDHGIEASNGGFVMQWRRREGLPDTVNASLVVWASRRRIERREVAIPPDRDRETVRIDLGPLLTPASLALRPPTAPESVPSQPPVVALFLPERPDDEVERALATWQETPAGGWYVASLSPGRFRVRVWDRASERRVLDEEMDLSPGATLERPWADAATAPSATDR